MRKIGRYQATNGPSLIEFTAPINTFGFVARFKNEVYSWSAPLIALRRMLFNTSNDPPKNGRRCLRIVEIDPTSDKGL